MQNSGKTLDQGEQFKPFDCPPSRLLSKMKKIILLLLLPFSLYGQHDIYDLQRAQLSRYQNGSYQYLQFVDAGYTNYDGYPLYYLVESNGDSSINGEYISWDSSTNNLNIDSTYYDGYQSMYLDPETGIVTEDFWNYDYTDGITLESVLQVDPALNPDASEHFTADWQSGFTAGNGFTNTNTNNEGNEGNQSNEGSNDSSGGDGSEGEATSSAYQDENGDTIEQFQNLAGSIDEVERASGIISDIADSALLVAILIGAIWLAWSNTTIIIRPRRNV